MVRLTIVKRSATLLSVAAVALVAVALPVRAQGSEQSFEAHNSRGGFWNRQVCLQDKDGAGFSEDFVDVNPFNANLCRDRSGDVSATLDGQAQSELAAPTVVSALLRTCDRSLGSRSCTDVRSASVFIASPSLNSYIPLTVAGTNAQRQATVTANSPRGNAATAIVDLVDNRGVVIGNGIGVVYNHPEFPQNRQGVPQDPDANDPTDQVSNVQLPAQADTTFNGGRYSLLSKQIPTNVNAANQIVYNRATVEIRGQVTFSQPTTVSYQLIGGPEKRITHPSGTSNFVWKVDQLANGSPNRNIESWVVQGSIVNGQGEQGADILFQQLDFPSTE